MLKESKLLNKLLGNRELMIYLVLFLLSPFFNLLYSIHLFLKDRKKYLVISLPFFLAIAASTQRSTGTVTTDITAYFSLLTDFSRKSFSEFLALKHSNIYSPIFHWPLYIISKIEILNLRHLIVLSVFIFYFTTLKALNKIKQNLFDDEISLIEIIAISLGILNFPQASELIKQQPAVGIVLLAVAFRNNKKRVISLIISALAVHLSSILFVFAFLISFLFEYSLIFIIPGMIFSVVDIVEFSEKYVCKFKEWSQDGLSELVCGRLIRYSEPTAWKATFREHYSICFLWVGILINNIFQFGKRIKQWPYEIWFCIACFNVLLINHGNTHNFIRFFHGMAPAIALGFILLNMSKKYYKQYQYIFGSAFVAYNFISIYLRMTRGTYQSSYFNNSILELFTTNIFNL